MLKPKKKKSAIKEVEKVKEDDDKSTITATEVERKQNSRRP